MGFVSSFEKRAESKKFTKNELKSLSDEPFGREVPMGRYVLRYHPLRKRWSCTCQDFQHRRQKAGDGAPLEDKYCKHIKSFLLGKSTTQIRAEEIASGYKFPIDFKKSVPSKKAKKGED